MPTKGVVRKVAVVGAGVAGLAAALVLRTRRIACEVFEAAPAAGGLLTPVSFRGVPCDRGSHRVLDDAWRALPPELRAIPWRCVPRRGVLVLGGRHLRYPPALSDLVLALGPRALAAMPCERFGAARRTGHPSPFDDEGFEAFMVARVGRTVYERFYRPYAEKVWGLPPDELSCTVGRQRLSTASPWRAIFRAPAYFWYPHEGMGALLDALLAACRRAGAEVRLGLVVRDRTTLDADRVIDTAALGEIADEPLLTHRGLYLLHLACAPGSVLGDADTWYVPDARYWFGRVSRPARFSPTMRRGEEDILAVEIPEGRWGPSMDFTARIEALVEQLVDAGIVRGGCAPTAAQQTFVRGVYPLYRRGWRACWDAAMARVVAMGRVFPAGRQGLFLHCNLDHAMATARDAAHHVAEGASAAHWAAQCSRYLTLRVRD